MIRYDEALKIIRELTPVLSLERLPLAEAVGRVLGEDLFAKIPSPPFTNSAVDGYALRLADLGPNRTLGVSAVLLAKPVELADLPPARAGSCVKIMTGALCPDWVDTVIPVEDADLIEGGVRFKSVPENGSNIRRAGEDLQEGAVVLKKGTLLGPERIMVAAAFGYHELSVLEKPHLMFFSTGDELAEPGEPLRPGAIYNSSKYFLTAAARTVGFPAAPHQTLADDEEAATNTIAEAISSRKPAILITTGAVSMGDVDFIPKIGERLGFKALFHKVAIRPGKPVYLAVKDQVVWLGLPGNPISTCVGWHAFGRPLLEAWAHIPAPKKKTLVLKNEVKKPEHLRCFYRAEVNGERVWVSQRQGSAQFAASVTSEAYVELPEGFSRIPAETKVEAIIL